MPIPCTQRQGSADASTFLKENIGTPRFRHVLLFTRNHQLLQVQENKSHLLFCRTLAIGIFKATLVLKTDLFWRSRRESGAAIRQKEACGVCDQSQRPLCTTERRVVKCKDKHVSQLPIPNQGMTTPQEHLLKVSAGTHMCIYLTDH